MEDGDFYYDDDDYGDYYGEAEETWETPLQAKYEDAKAVIESNPTESIRLLSEVVTEDPQKGMWTFKSLKKLARASRNAKLYDDMMTYFAQFACFASEEVDATARMKAMSKFVEKTSRLPREYRVQAIDATLAETAKDMDVCGRLWLATMVKKATCYTAVQDWAAALPVLQEALAWCYPNRVTGNEVPLNTIYALLLEAYSCTGQAAPARETYFAAIEAGTAAGAPVPPRVVAALLESGGHMYLRDGDWHAAYRAFQAAFRLYSDCGDAQGSSALKYAVIADMLCGTPIDSFAANDSKGEAESPALQPIARLLGAFMRGDVTSAIATVRDEANRDIFVNDPLLGPYVEPLLHRLRLNVLICYVSSFMTVTLADVARRLCLDTEEEAEDLCAFAILLRLITASIDGPARVLRVHSTALSSDQRRANALYQWAGSITLSTR